ncbi:Protein of unknown function [Colwellia chukchiensis]|uniref:DUF3718 domain-containing protein n=1 Tax=Colwellia chukchiensis TaxID=641665 RepID=A0A1H7M340_9GAMM|nr:DUF3718 domain-containing protein [Colwellia chukchiensis]SEL05656.1 Protein of unknown function [Colwellia chukchiensis]
MKNILLALAITLLLSAYSAQSHAQNVALSLCEYVSVDDKSRLRSFLKTNKLKIRQIFDDVKCNGQNLVAFAGSNNAIKTGSLMLAKLPKATVEGLISTISSTELTAVAQKRING